MTLLGRGIWLLYSISMKKLIAFIKQLWDKTISSSNNDYLKSLEKEIARYEKTIVNKEGFSIKYFGRWGYLYYVENGNMCRIFSEFSGVPEYTILIAFEAHEDWHFSVKRTITATEKEEIRLKLIAWLKKEKIKALLY